MLIKEKVNNGGTVLRYVTYVRCDGPGCDVEQEQAHASKTGKQGGATSWIVPPGWTRLIGGLHFHSYSCLANWAHAKAAEKAEAPSNGSVKASKAEPVAA